MQTPRETAAQIARRNADRDASKYLVETLTARFAVVQHIGDTDRTHSVHTDADTLETTHCDCPFFAIHGVCKHGLMVEDLRREDARAEAEENYRDAAALLDWTREVHMNPDAYLEPVW